MRAFVVNQQGVAPCFAEFPEPSVQPNSSLVTVAAGAIGPTDLMRANGFFGPVTSAYVLGGEGVGRLADSRRVYFGHAIAPFGAFSPRTVVTDAEIWPIPDNIDDAQAIALGISGTGALIPLEDARIKPGERVLILGATGPVGQIALQLARAMGAGLVVGAARSGDALQRLRALGYADEVVQLGGGDDVSKLKVPAGPGYDVVLDVIYGPPAEAAMRATAPGARMMSIGIQAGPTVTLSLRDLVFRSHMGVGTGQRSAEERSKAYGRLLAYALKGQVKADVTTFDFDRAEQAWQAQAGSPHSKIIVTVTN
jgi:NADPH:quinone reductase-like Zn-dependent oxidoreductase